MAGPISETTIDVDGVEVFVRRTEGPGPPVVFCHGNPTHSGQWIPFLERLERPGIAFDLPGFGRSATPSPRHFDYSMHGIAGFLGRTLDRLGIDEYAQVVQDWGGVALIEAIARRDRLDRLVVIDSVPLLPGYRWHWIAKYFWRVPIVGELFNLGVTRVAMDVILRQANAKPGPMPAEFIDLLWSTWRRGFGRPILKLYRSADPPALAAAGVGLGEIDCPALVIWGEQDPYIPARFGRMYAERLPNAELVELPDAGHWPWIDRPDVIDRVTAFLET